MNAKDGADRLERIAATVEDLRANGPRTTVESPKLVSLLRWRCPQGPSSPDRTLLLSPGDIFSLDGDEPVDLQELIREGFCEYIEQPAV